MRTLGAILFPLLAISCQGTHPASAKGQLHFSATIDGATLSVAADGKTGSMDLAEQVARGKVIGSQVIFSTRNARGVFFVIDFLTASRSRGPSGDCDGGEENLVWVALNPSLRPLNATSALINSCDYSVASERGIQQDAHSISVRYDGAMEHVRRFLFFRKHAPELGFSFEQTPLPEAAPDNNVLAR